jgi:DHA1 family bicyclomycin/chloramphenicol resistance-like MFS transporter
VDDLHTQETSVQLTLTGTLVGLAIGQLLIGPFSDAVGRRQPLLIGMGLHVLASLLCLVAPNVTALGALRVLQGFGSAAATVVAMAVVRDLVSGVRAAKVISRLILVLGAAPILAPMLGTQVLRFSNWRGIFVALAVFGVAIGVMAALALPETLPTERRLRGDLRTTLRAYRGILRDRSFVGLVLTASFGMAAVFAYVSGTSFVLQKQYGLSAQAFALVFACGAIGLIGAAQLNVALLERYTPRQIMRGALGISCFGVVVMFLLAAAHVGGLPALLVPMWLALTGIGLVMPNASAMALSRHGEAAGTAAAIAGFLQFGVGAATAPLVGAFGNTGLAMAAVMTVSLLGALASLLFLVRTADLAAGEKAAEPAVAHA